MSTPVASAAEFLARLDAVERRLATHATLQPPDGLTDPDPGSGEQWDAGQVWAHLAEFIPYWMDEIRMLLSAREAVPASFGRVKSDPNRIAAIERARHEPPAVLMGQLRAAIVDLRDLLNTLGSQDWSAHGRHPTLGIMNVERIVDEFLVEHLEQHAAQLDNLSRSRKWPERRL